MISIIVPIYKVEEYINQCVDSIINQTYKDIEIILVDDGSPDNCPQICDDYAAHDSRIKVVHKENGGLMSARQAGLKVATGEYVGFVDGDDWIEADMYEKIAESVEKYHADLVYCEFLYCYPDRNDKSGQINKRELYDKKQLEEDIYPYMFFKKPYYNFGVNPCCWSKLFKRELLERVLYPVTPKIKIGEDAAFSYPALLAAESVSYVGDYLYHYRINPEAMTKKYDKNMENYILIPYEILLDTVKKYPYDFSNQLNYYLLFLLNGIVRNEANGDNKKPKSERIKTLKKFALNDKISNVIKTIDMSILPFHTKIVAFCLAHKNANLLYLYSLVLRRFM